jgi:hypothetical protein
VTVWDEAYDEEKTRKSMKKENEKKKTHLIQYEITTDVFK